MWHFTSFFLDFQYNITADVDSLEKRIVFMESSSPTVVPDVMVDINQEHCQTFRVYVQVCSYQYLYTILYNMLG